MQRVLIRASLSSWDGYGQVASWLGKGLERLGVPVVYEGLRHDEEFYPLDPWVRERIVKHPTDEYSLQVCCPTHPSPQPSTCVIFTMWETAGIAPRAVTFLNHAQAVIVPCSWCATVLSAAGVTRPLYRVPLGVSAEEGYTYEPLPSVRPYFTFGMAGRMRHGGCRKGLNEGMHAFASAFGANDPVQLRVKVWPDDLPYLSVPDHPRIKVDPQPGTPQEIAAWLKRLHVYCCPSKGEGWGLLTHQAMMCGRPVMAARWSGTAEFWDDRAGWELAYDLLGAQDFYRGEGVWAGSPVSDPMVETFRQVWRERWGLYPKSVGAWHLAQRYTWDRTARELYGALRSCGWELPLQSVGRNGSMAQQSECVRSAKLVVAKEEIVL